MGRPVEGRVDRYGGRAGPPLRAWDRTTMRQSIRTFLVIAAAFPFLTGSDYHVRVGINVLLLAMLAVGLNIVVGWAGLLDLGYVAFYGSGRTRTPGSRRTTSTSTGRQCRPCSRSRPRRRWSASWSASLASPDRRLPCDRHALLRPDLLRAHDQPRPDQRPLVRPDARTSPAGRTASPASTTWSSSASTSRASRTTTSLLLIAARRRRRPPVPPQPASTGRAFRAIREDPLAAETDDHSHQLAKAARVLVGAAVAGLTGTVFAAVQTGTFPQNFQVMLLIMIYAALVLGGLGSIPVRSSALSSWRSVPEILRTPDTRGGSSTGGLHRPPLDVRPWRGSQPSWPEPSRSDSPCTPSWARGWPDAVGGEVSTGGVIASGIDGWVVFPAEAQTVVGNFAFVALVAAVLALTRLAGWYRAALLVPPCTSPRSCGKPVWSSNRASRASFCSGRRWS